MTKYSVKEVFTEEEIERITDYMKRNGKDSSGIFNIAREKFEKGMKIERVNSTRTFLNVHMKKLNKPTKIRITQSKENKEIQGIALTLYALGNLCGLSHKNLYIMVPGFCTKHSKEHCNPNLYKMKKDLDQKIDQYELEDFSGIPNFVLGSSSGSNKELFYKVNEREKKRKKKDDYLGSMVQDVRRLIKEKGYSEIPIDTYNIIEIENFFLEGESLVVKKNLELVYNDNQ